MKVSVVIPTYNKLDQLRRTLGSLAAQDLAPDAFETVVIDDGSRDGTLAYLESHRPAHGFRVVRGETNRGRAAARNLGLETAEGGLIVFLDDDMELVPGFLRAHLEFHRSHANSVGVGNVQNHPEVSAAPIDRYMSTRGAQKIKGRGPLPWKYFTTNNASLRKEELTAVGGFDENFVFYGFEDLELAWRLVRDRGLSIGFVTEARSLHIHAHSLEDVLAKKTLCGRSSLPYLFQKHPETRPALGFHRFDPPRAGEGVGLNLSRILYRTLLTRPVYRAVKPLAGIDLGGLTDKVIDYLVQYHYLQGLRNPQTADGQDRSG